jgi:ABC-2 type transport system ATP-binding protein
MDHDVVDDYRRARRNLGVVPQEVVYDPFFNVREVLRIQSGYFGLGSENESWIEELMGTLMLTDKAGANMRTLSGGMKRRVMIAQALVHKPRVVVLDEPTAGVDVQLRKSLWAFIKRLHREGHTIVLSTHYLEEAEMLCDRIGILNHGRLVALDTKRNLLARGVGKTLCLCITSADPLPPLPEKLAGKVRYAEGHRLELQLQKDTDSIIEVMNALEQSGVTITDFHTEEADLEDVFVELTRSQSQ